jgi:hypothetical protein
VKRIGSVLGLGVLALTLTGIATPAKAPPTASGTPTKATITSRGLSIKGAVGSFCLPVEGGPGVCEDSLFDPTPTRGRLPIRAGGRLAIRTGAPAKLVSIQLLRADAGATEPEFTSRSLRARAPGASKQRWLVKLPGDLKGANLVSVFVRYTFGDASFDARVRTGGACGPNG